MTEQSPLHWRQLFRLGPNDDYHWLGLRAGVGVLLPLAVLAGIDRLDLAVFAIFGAFTGIYGRNRGHLDRLVAQIRSGALFFVVILGAGLTSSRLVEHGTTGGLWLVVGLTTVVAWGCSVLAGYLRLRPGGSLFHI